MTCGAAKYDQRVTIEYGQLATPDGFGETNRVWGYLADRWASIESLTGRELFESQQTKAQATHRVLLRFESLTSSINEGNHRLKFKGRTLNITSAIDIDSRGVEIELLCTEPKD